MSFERLVPGTREWSMFYANHIQRYRFAAREIAELGVTSPRVLDAACGVGYGARHLAESAGARVAAVDRDLDAVEAGRRHFDHPAISWYRDDCHSLAECAHLAPFDAVTSFETLEHLPRPLDFLRRCRELLAPGGLLLVSTPNGDVASPGGKVAWEHHEREYIASELLAILHEAGFREAGLFGQRLTALGRLRRDIRGEINRLRSNPAVRAGAWLQRVLRGHAAPPPALPETEDDLEIVPLGSAAECEALGTEGPFVLIGRTRS